MAKKNKKDAEENIENKEEFNDIDENFGLPDLELEPLDDSSEESVEEEVVEQVVEEVAEEEAESETFSSDYAADTEEQEEALVAAQVADEEGFNADEYKEEEASEEEKPAYVPGTYAAKAKEQESNSGKIIGIVALLLIVGAVLWFFMYYQPAQVEVAEKAKQEQIAADKAKKEKQRLADEAAAEEERLKEEARLQAEEDAQPKIGTIETISEKTSRYYVVVSSGLDGDLAMDYAKKEVNNGTNIKLLSPRGTNKFYRVTIADYDTWVAAENSANDFKSTFGDGVWVLKY